MSEPWTIEKISRALDNPTAVQRFLGEINRAPAHTLLTVFAKWQRVAESVLDGVAQARGLAQYDERGEALPGEWVDATERVADEAEAGRRGAA